MAELKATVCLQGKDIEVISSHIEFNRKTDNKGRPVTNVIGGRMGQRIFLVGKLSFKRIA